MSRVSGGRWNFGSLSLVRTLLDLGHSFTIIDFQPDISKSSLLDRQPYCFFTWHLVNKPFHPLTNHSKNLI